MKKNVILIAGICFVLIFAYIYLCFCIFRKVPIDSDMANMVLEADDIFHGNIFLSDWVLTGISFLTTDLLFFVIGVMGYGIHTNAFYAAITLMFVICSFSSLLLFKWRDLKYGVINVLIWLSVGALPVGISPNVLKVHTAIWIYVFAACFFIDRMYQKGKSADQSKRYLYAALFFVCVMLGTIGDAIILVGLVVPVFIVCFYLWLAGPKQSKFVVKLALLTITGAAFGIMLDKLYFIIGGANKRSYLFGTSFKNLNYIPDSFILYIKGLLGLFDADFTRRGVFRAETFICGLRFLIVVFGLYIIVKTIAGFFKGKNNDIVSVVLSIGFVVLSIFYIFTGVSVDIWTTRYYAYTPVLFSVLIGRFLSERAVWSLTLFPRKIRVLYGVLAMCAVLVMGVAGVYPGQKWTEAAEYNPYIELGIAGFSPKQKWTTAAAYSPYIELGNVLINNGLESGYSSFLDASVTTVTTKNRCRIRAVNSDGKCVMPMFWFCKNSWYTEYANFVVIGYGYGGINENNITVVLGEPYKRLFAAGFVIYVYNRDISKEIKTFFFVLPPPW
jgi:hypothetical protein